MNCKPGQLAVLSRTTPGVPELVHYLGMVFRVTSLCGRSELGAQWLVEPGPTHRVDNPGHWRKGDPIEAVADCLLTPLPDDPEPLSATPRLEREPA